MIVFASKSEPNSFVAMGEHAKAEEISARLVTVVIDFIWKCITIVFFSTILSMNSTGIKPKAPVQHHGLRPFLAETIHWIVSGAPRTPGGLVFWSLC